MRPFTVLAAIVTLACSHASAQDSISPPISGVSILTAPEYLGPIQQVSCQFGGGECGSCSDGCGDCCQPYWAHKHNIFGEWLYLKAREQAVDFATPVDGTTNTAVPVGPTAVFQPDYQSGLRVGGGLAIDRCSSLTFGWTNYQSNVSNTVTLPGGSPAPNAFLRSDLAHPNTVDVATDSLFATGNYGIDFVNADAAYTKTLKGDCNQRLNGTLGFRYGNLKQDLRTQQRILDDVLVDTDIDFNGYGPRLALDYERINCKGWLMYVRGGVSLLAGRFDADYRQSSVFRGPQATAGISEDRIVPQWEMELGTGWESRNGAFRITAGYLMSAWTNVLTTPSFIDGIQAEELDNINETLTFDGLGIRAQVLF